MSMRMYWYLLPLTVLQKGKDKFGNIPLDTRHVDAKVRKAKKGGHAYGRGHSRPTISDFPVEWLPPQDPASVDKQDS